MKRISFIILATLMLGSMVSQAQYRMNPEEVWKCAEVFGSNYHGFAFHKDWDVDVSIKDEQGRFTPTDADIAMAEKIMQKKLAYLNRDHINQEGRCPVIDEYLNKYTRQYVGFMDEHGFRVIWMNFVWDDKLEKLMGNDIVLAEGGCGHFWHLSVNLDTEKAYNLEVNGSGEVKHLPRKKRPGPRISKPRNEFHPQRIRKTGIIHDESEKQF